MALELAFLSIFIDVLEDGYTKRFKANHDSESQKHVLRK